MLCGAHAMARLGRVRIEPLHLVAARKRYAGAQRFSVALELPDTQDRATVRKSPSRYR
jgi:hypothetical protein